ncbi:glycoside hydrolase family 53 protein [Mucilaginibacter dorajii]|uniref:Arabinogalactan endo-beta-1,4-galactanase n=1 Tax=Mucilaginibacter dorajii TaxID=692994 RepID=A0ABP7PMU0_9SPHI|nr:arabinogalactan endo-1,4-beta-galactosidase [Mucilaginibacter dorajii]MCS3736323.1 arabinogalactan endo-1,4-beta-galactosidase [Mucilaginibacter dorajii]
MKGKNIIAFVVLLALAACKKDNPASGTKNTNTTDTTQTNTSALIKGADVSWLTQMEASGYKFYNSDGAAQDCMALLKDKGMNAIRLRAWVNPADGWCNTDDVIAKALRAQKLGMKIMIDLHYSDTWADPGKQPKPVAWQSLDFAGLKAAVSTYTLSVMNALKAKGITPDWVQVGNETNDGMLWEDGRASTNMAGFAALISSGYNAVKSVSSSTKVIVHLANGYDNAVFRWLFDGLKANGAKWDIIGMSLYPSTTNWQSYNMQCQANMNDMFTRYGTPSMIVEVGMPATEAATCKAFLSDLLSKVNTVSGGQGLGVFYWEPEAYNWQSYGLGAFDTSGRATVALDAFK